MCCYSLIGWLNAWQSCYRLASVDPDWVKVFHVAHCDAVVVLVTHNLILELLPTLPAIESRQKHIGWFWNGFALQEALLIVRLRIVTKRIVHE